MTKSTSQYFPYRVGGEEYCVSREEINFIKSRAPLCLVGDSLEILVQLMDAGRNPENLSRREQEALEIYHEYACFYIPAFQQGGGI